jgi:hypothetical protein
MGPSVVFDIQNVESFAIISDSDFQPIIASRNFYMGMASLSMLPNIAQGFLNNVSDLDLRSCGERENTVICNF